VSQVKWNVEHLVHVDSTNTWLAKRAREGADEGLVVYSDFQSAGRGRLEREWHAPSGSSLLCSALVNAPTSTVAPQWIVVAAALAVGDALEGLTGRRPDLKWPNDVLYGDLKVAGLLAEVIVTHVTRRIVVGLGLNLTDVDPDFESATTVLAVTGATLAPVRALGAYLEALDRRRTLLDTPEGIRQLGVDYTRALVTLGQRVRVEVADGPVRGRAVGIDDHGGLRVDTGSEVRAFSAGDVVHVRGEDSE
jgi:BirA family biotin operon repressor/biotin-[acetyl-CoA-carboxylase] ligase